MRASMRYAVSDRGFSAAEMVVVTALMAIITGTAYMALNMVTNVSDGIMARDDAYQSGQLAIEKMSKELREAQILTDGSQNEYRLNPNVPPTPTRICFAADVDHNGYLERVTYQLAAGSITRRTATTTKVNPTWNDFGADSAPTVITNRVDPTQTTFLFALKDPDEATTTIIEDIDAGVRSVQITLRTVAKSGSKSATVEFPVSAVQVRAFAPGITPG
jgi:prepilin-type N-terminal cleavage/methylation domain-containing protein